MHLSFAGMLTAVQAPVNSADIGTTTLWAWDFERTHWIRSVFTTVESLGAIMHKYGD